MRGRRLAIFAAIVAAALSAMLPAAAQATFPGRNGMIVALFSISGRYNERGNFVGIDPDGHARRIYFCTEYVGNCGAEIENPSVSADGKELAFNGGIETDSYVNQDQITLLRFGRFGLTLVPFTSSNEEENDTTPAWIPGHDAFVFAVATAVGAPSPALESEPAAGGSVTTLVRCRCDHPAVSPNGANVVYDRGPALWRVGIDGSSPTMIAARGSHASWSPNGNQITFVSGRSVFVSRPNGDRRRRLAPTGSNPVWSPNGRLIAYVVDDENNGLRTKFFTRPAKGGKAHLLYTERIGALGSSFGGMDWQAVGG